MTSGIDQKESVQPSHYVGIGASAGGLEALEAFFVNMSPESNLAFIVIQHLSPDYKSLMVELLSKKTAMPVHRAEDGMEVHANSVYLIPPKKNLTIFHGRLVLNDKEVNQGISLPIDIFFRSLAEDQGDKTIAIVLSGTGSDGTRGVRAIKEMGGMVMVQDESTAKFDGMPRAAISTGVADFILSPEKMPGQLLGYVSHPYISGKRQADLLLQDADALTRLFAELRDKTKVDFTHYKPSTITRRIERRMSVNQLGDFEEYVRYLQSYPGEVIALYRDLLIGVTSFFRDPEAMQALEEKWLPTLLARLKNREIRCWVAGCSTGEEAYTLAILLKEAMEKLAISRDIKIFATDIDREAIVTASTGIYPESIAGDLPPLIMGKYFYHKEEKLQIARHIREMVVFAQHNLIKDPPFTNIDLISCRNLLIYLQPVLQQKVFSMFNFSLNPEGLLFLGSSESIGEMGDCFEVLHQKGKIFRSRGKAQPLRQELEVRDRGERGIPRPLFSAHKRDRRIADAEGNMVVRQYLEMAAEHYLPLSVIVNERLQIVHIVGNSDGFFKIPSGPVEYDIAKLAARDLAIPLTTGVQKVFRSGEELSYTNIRLQHRNEDRNIRIRIRPLPELKGHEALVVVFFEEIESRPITGDTPIIYDAGAEVQQRIADLEQELQFARENLQATIEELETSNEELQATNEELLASNEELQSTNEELQSTNEELYTVNAEHQNKIIELTELNNDVDNLLTSSRIGTLLLDEDLEIRKFSPEVTKIFHILEKDIGRPLTHITHRLLDFEPMEMIRAVRENNIPCEEEIQAEGGRWYLVRAMPYSIGPSAYSGVVLTFIDISDARTAKSSLANSRKNTEDISQYIPAGLLLYRTGEQGQLVLESSNPEAERMTGISTEKWAGKTFDEIWPAAEKLGLTARLRDVVKTGEVCSLENFRYDDGQFSGVYRICAFRLAEGRLAVSFEDVTDRIEAEDALRRSRQFILAVIDSLSSHICVIDQHGVIVAVNNAWREFAAKNRRASGDVSTIALGEGSNYLSVCARATGSDGDVARQFAEGIRAVLDGQIADFSLEYPCHSPDQQRWFMGRVTRLTGYTDRHAVVAHENISDRVSMRQEIEESERQYRSLFETMAQGVVYQNSAGKIVAANPAAERILGMSLAQMRGITSDDPRWRAIREDGSDLPGDEHPAMVALRSGKPVFGFVMGVHSSSFTTPRWILVSASPQFRDGYEGPYEVYTTFEDITDRRTLLASGGSCGPGCHGSAYLG